VSGLLQVGRHAGAHHAQSDKAYFHYFLRMAMQCAVLVDKIQRVVPPDFPH
jgi:hypothetical protein